MLRAAGFSVAAQTARCYVLVGYGDDTLRKAEKRLRRTWEAGFFPMAMLYRDRKGEYEQTWKRFQREWANPVIVGSKVKKERKDGENCK
jgi:hypothetical protein